MFNTITVIGAGGRAGSAIAGRLRERGIELREEGGELVLLCVPDAAIPDVAASCARPLDGTTSGATTLEALAPHDGGSASIRSRRSCSGAGRSSWTERGAPSRRDARGARARDWLATTLGLRAVRARGRRPAALPRRRRVRLQLPGHAHRRRGGAPARPARRRRRSSRSCAARSRTASCSPARSPRRLGDGRRPRRRDPRAAARAGARSTARSRTRRRPMKIARTSSEARAALPPGRTRRPRPDDGRAPRRAPLAVRAARAECDIRRQRVREPGAVRRGEDLVRYPRDEERRPRRCPRRPASILSSARPSTEMYPPGFQTWVDVSELGSRAGGRPPARALPRRRDGVPQALRHRPAGRRVLRPEGRAAGGGDRAADRGT